MKIKYICIFIFISFLVLSAQTWQNFTTDNSPLPSNQVNSIVISDDGTVWFGTDDGLAALKNNKWRAYSSNDGLSSNKINSLSFLPNWTNDLWLSSDYGSTNFLVDSTEISSELEYINTSNSEILSDTLLAIEMDSLQNKWIGTDAGLSIITNTGIYNISEANGLDSNMITALNSRANEWVHVATAGGGVSRLKYNGVDGITSASIILKQWSFLASDTVLAIYVTDDTLRWYGTVEGVSTHFGDKTKDVPVNQGGSWWIYNTFTSGIVDNYCRAITSDGEGNMWFGTRGGLSKYNTIDSTWTSYTVIDGLISNNIFDVEIDKDKNVWIATDEGVSKFSELSTAVAEENNLPDNYKISLKTYPNPFNPTTNIEFTIGQKMEVTLKIYNIIGELVKSVDSKLYEKGTHNYIWNATDAMNKNVNSGIYIVNVSSKYENISYKITLLK